MQHAARLLVVDDDPMIREELAMLFEPHPYEVASAASIPEALEKLAQQRFALALVDVRIGGADGIELTREIRERFPDVDVIMITGYGSIKNAVEAIRRGAVDYITKPFVPEDLLLATKNALERRRLIDEVEYLRRELSERYAFANMVSRNPVMLDIFATVAMLAENDVTVLICGESGTGKELVARAIHYQGKRRAGRFVPINCAALPESLLESELFGYERGAFTGAVQDRVGKIELAHGGTLFLDEVEIIPPAMQAKLLRVLEERAIERLGGNKRIAVDMRVVVATNQDLTQLVREGRLREDFYYRINVVPVMLPPLRQRREDIPLLADRFLQSAAERHKKKIAGLDPQVVELLTRFHWPGNVRELQNELERAVALAREGEPITVTHLSAKLTAPETALPPAAAAAAAVAGAPAMAGAPPPATPAAAAEPAPGNLPLREARAEFESRYISNMLRLNANNVSRTARALGLSRVMLQRKMKEYGLRSA